MARNIIEYQHTSDCKPFTILTGQLPVCPNCSVVVKPKEFYLNKQGNKFNLFVRGLINLFNKLSNKKPFYGKLTPSSKMV